MFVPFTALLYDSTAATRTLKQSTTPLSISCGIHLMSLLMISSLVCGLFSQTLSFKYSPQKIFRRVEILGIGWPGVIGLMQNESVPWEVTCEVFKCSVREMRWRLISRTEHLNTSGGIPQYLTWIPLLSQTREDIIRREIRWITQERLNRVVDNLMFDLLLCCHTAARSMERT